MTATTPTSNASPCKCRLSSASAAIWKAPASTLGPNSKSPASRPTPASSAGARPFRTIPGAASKPTSASSANRPLPLYGTTPWALACKWPSSTPQANRPARRIIRLCTRHGLLDDTAADPLADEEPVLAALAPPPPRFHLLRYHGVLAPRARDRGRIVPAKPVEESTAADRASSAPPDLPSRPGAGRTAECALNAPSGPELIRIRAHRQPEWTPSSVEGGANDPPGVA